MTDHVVTGLNTYTNSGLIITGPDTVTVEASAQIIATGSGSDTIALQVKGTGSVVHIYGTIYGQLMGATLGNSSSDDQDVVATIYEGAVIRSGSYSGVFLNTGGGTLTNAGSITGATGLDVFAQVPATTMVINSGSIIGTSSTSNYAGMTQAGWSTLVLVNTGLIKGAVHAFDGSFNSTGVTDIANSGVMIGNVLMGAGHDIYDGRYGIVDGTVDGGSGNDTIRGGALAETLAGGTGNDTLEGNAGADTLTGGTGNDSLDGGAGADAMTGGAGDDIYTIDDAGDTVTELDAEGDDTVNTSIAYTLTDYVERLTLTGSASIAGTGNTLANTITGNAGDNTLSGLAGADTLSGGDGADTLDGGADADTLTGGAGHDSLDGGTGADAMTGGAGNDIYTIDDAGDTVTELDGEGTDAVNASITYTLTDHVETLTLTGSAAINGTGNALANTLTGNAGNNSLSGLAGADTLTGGDGNDALSGGAGADTLFGGTGNDTLDGGTEADAMTGGAGNDVYTVDNSGDRVTEASGEGTDTVRASIALTLGANVENLILTGTTAINGTGNTLANALTGNAAANTLSGLAGNDTLNGLAGIDTLKGGDGNDLLKGGADNDLLTGGAGADRLYGETGADRFIFTALTDSTVAVAGRDTIFDFSHAQGDRIDLSALDARSTVAGNQAFAFIGETAFTGVAGQLRTVNTGGDTFVYGDVNGDKVADFAIAVEGTIDFVASDFLL